MLRGKLMLNLLLRQMDLNFQISWYGLWSTPSWEEGDRETSLLPVSEVPPYPATGLKRLPGFFVIKGDVINIYKGRRHCLCARPWGPMPHIELLTHWYGQISTHGPDQLPLAKRWIDATKELVCFKGLVKLWIRPVKEVLPDIWLGSKIDQSSLATGYWWE